MLSIWNMLYIRGRPLIFEQNLLILRALSPGDVPLQVPLNEAEFWVQVHNVPYGFMNIGTARRIGNSIGKFISFDENQLEEKWRSYMRIRVNMDVGKPFKVGTTLTKGPGTGHWVDFKYEKLPSFCFVSGIIRHADRYCPLVYEHKSGELAKPYGVGLRAGGGGKARSMSGNKWIVPEGSVGGRGGFQSAGIGRIGTGRQSCVLIVAGDNTICNEEEETSVEKEITGKQKRKRTWEEEKDEEVRGDKMALDVPKNGDGAGPGYSTRREMGRWT
ncbi:unnamed protein product [Cuscuta europaea]|uniref:Zinc knuckle CX2CX4HX4C domain-containing protein n=1 Tax=Cuscuta europaea TaxID=41803 RepID=A0A9P0ZRD5_CUSEU|nr:unnamed protein product [Cuscuta europaea]